MFFTSLYELYTEKDSITGKNTQHSIQAHSWRYKYNFSNSLLGESKTVTAGYHPYVT